ncbi:DNA pilot protein [Blackfly microvirus SF02]|uniref:DNA pilot protein n=1 Tax=Blackfly microvirus SF02 TaxID=2576452 RepID=A0A4P8PKM8_9VIRU|nr:DNA pilot protein [Blackfly microvirus SF02]
MYLNKFICNIFGVDDMLIGAGITAAGGIFNNVLAGQRQEDAQDYNTLAATIASARNMDEAARNRGFQADQATINRDWQEQQTSTAYQRAVADMKSAGLNPILAYQRGGASSGGGAQASGSQGSAPTSSTTAAPVHDIVGPAVSTALQMRRMAYEIENMKATNENIQANTGQAMSSARVNDQVAKKTEAETLIRAQELAPAKKAAIEADLERQNLESGPGAVAKRIGHAAKLVQPVFDTANSAVSIAKPFRSFDMPSTETTKSGSSWKDMTGGNHYQDTTFTRRWPGK